MHLALGLSRRFTIPMTVTLLVTLVGFSQPALSEGKDHSELACSLTDSKVCAHLGFTTELSTAEDGEFVAHIFTADEAPISDLKIKLWMPEMGHGTSPVQIENLEANHFKVSKAHFVMTGKWQVHLDFNFANSSHHIEIPVEIQK